MKLKLKIGPLVPFILLIPLWMWYCTQPLSAIKIKADLSNAKIAFGLEAVQSALGKKSLEARMVRQHGEADIIFDLMTTEKSTPEGFRIRKEQNIIEVLGYDTAGLMYGALELAEQIQLYGLEGVKNTDLQPHMRMRGTKFNIPLDLRTPSYSDASDAAQKNIPEMWNFEFWKAYIDQLAQYRFNFISLWSLHPFPSLVKVPEYPDVALDDVQRSTGTWEEYYHLHATGLDAPHLLNNPEIIKRMTMDEKITFWQEVMAYAKDRNIQFYVVTWNIFTNGSQGKYGITDDIDNPVTIDYFRKSVAQLFRTYPDLAGIGLTTGENMDGATFTEKEDWAFNTYALGLLEVAQEMPDRKFTFIHRQHFAATKEITEKFKPLIEQKNIEFIFSFKYAQAHVFSTTEPSFHEKFIQEIDTIKTIWTLRNDDNYHFRWGAPDFVRTFIKNMPVEVSRGLYYGSDQWVWGRDFLTITEDSVRQIEIRKHWYHWMLWGRLAFQPDLENERFIDLIKDRFPEVEANLLFNAWQAASMIYPITTGFHWGPLDFQWYIEGCRSRPAFAQNETGFHDVNRFINLLPHPKSGFQSIPDFIRNVDSVSNLISPLAVSQSLHTKSDTALSLLSQITGYQDQELKYTVNDIHCMAYLGKYYAHKIAGSTYLARYRQNQFLADQENAIRELENALQFWIKYTESALKQNRHPLWTNRVGYVDWEKTTTWVEEDITIARRG